MAPALKSMLIRVYVVLSCLSIRVFRVNEPRHEISNNVVCATSKASDQPAQSRSLIRVFASRLNILWVLSYWLNIICSFKAYKEAAHARLSLHLSICHIVETSCRGSYALHNWATTCQNQQNECAPSEDLDQHEHPPSLIKVFHVRSDGN